LGAAQDYDILPVLLFQLRDFFPNVAANQSGDYSYFSRVLEKTILPQVVFVGDFHSEDAVGQ